MREFASADTGGEQTDVEDSWPEDDYEDEDEAAPPEQLPALDVNVFGPQLPTGAAPAPAPAPPPRAEAMKGSAFQGLLAAARREASEQEGFVVDTNTGVTCRVDYDEILALGRSKPV
jgi:hypothetical protein